VFYAIRLLRHSWYIRHGKDAVDSTQKLNEAVIYEDRKNAETVALLLTTALPAWIKKVRVVKVKKLYVDRVYCPNPRDSEECKRFQIVKVPHWVTC
jgi:hypothetical protein